MSKILIIEDEVAIADLEKDYLELSDFKVDICNTGDEGLKTALAGDYDLIILDLMLPGMDGFEVCKKIREEKNIPILMVSAKKDDIDKIRGLGLGADDYMTKPFSPSELVARVKAHMARYERLVGTNQKQQNDIVEIRGIRIDKTARRVYVDGVADTPEKMDKYIKTIYNKAIDMDRLINELTTYSGIDNNRIPYNFHRINVADYFGDCVEEVGLDLEQRGIKLNYSNLVSPDTVVIADPEQMKKVINNIISNSVKYMDKPNGHIDIRILDEVDAIRVEIEDNGKGIAQKDLQKIFERFYRTDASRNSAQGGSGIGLSIVKKIIEDHGGYVWATAKEGEGTCMHFVLRKYIELQPGGTK